MKRLFLFFAGFCVTISLVCPLCGFSAAEEESDTLYPGTDYASMQELEAGMANYRQTLAGQKPFIYGSAEQDQFYANASTIYIPKVLADKTSYITRISTFPSSFEIEYTVEDKLYLFSYLYDSDNLQWLTGGMHEYKESREPEYLWKESKSGEKSVYSWYDPHFSYTASNLGESHYAWEQDGIAFRWQIPDQKPDDKFLSWCDAVSIPLNIKLDLGLDLAVGWQEIDGDKYYFETPGVAVTNDTVIDGVWYVFHGNGTCAGTFNGWASSAKGRKYYENGKYITGKRDIDGAEYNFDENGYAK